MKIEGRPRTKKVVDMRTSDPPTAKHQSKLSVLADMKPLIKKDTPLSRQVEGFFKIPRLSEKEQWDKNLSVIDEVYAPGRARGPRERFRNDNAYRRDDSTRDASAGKWIKQTRGPKK